MAAKDWCLNSGTYASFDERSTDSDQHARCEHCGRHVKLRKSNVIPRHLRSVVTTKEQG